MKSSCRKWVVAAIALGWAHTVRAQSTETLGRYQRLVDLQVTAGGHLPSEHPNLKAVNGALRLRLGDHGALRLDTWYLDWSNRDSHSAAAVLAGLETATRVSASVSLNGVIGLGFFPYTHDVFRTPPNPFLGRPDFPGGAVFSLGLAAHWRRAVVEQYYALIGGDNSPGGGQINPLMVGLRF